MFQSWKLAPAFVFFFLSVCIASVSSAQQQPVGAQVAEGQQAAGNQAYGGQSNASQQDSNPDVALVDQIAIPVPIQPFELTPQEAEYLDKLLGYWQTSSEKVKQFSCEFKRFDYDSGEVQYRDPRDNRLAAAVIKVGEIRYAAPDRGYYETVRTWSFKSPPNQPGEEAIYEEVQDEAVREKWVCDGSAVYDFDFSQKVLYEDEIPAEMRGAQIVNSPIPFLFGAKKDDIQNRYWARPIPQSNENEFWIEAYPKRIEDARMYSKVEIVLDRTDFLPKAIHAYLPQYNPEKGNFESKYFLFENREVNDRLARFQDFMGIFVKPQLPAFGGWRKLDRMAAYREKQANAAPNEIK
jgi:TIGR03009 family protein